VIEHQSPVVMPVMSARQAASWHGLMDLHEKVPTGWTLVGGQMVHLHCAERGEHPERPTDDIDTVVDVRASSDMLETFTQALLDLGFEPDTSGGGLQHRWRRDDAQIDVLLPDGVGARTSARAGAGGAPTLPTPGGTQALHRSDAVEVEVDGRVGTVRRPNLVGALVIKAAAHTAVGDAGLARHRLDFVTLAALVARRDFRETDLTSKDRKRLSDVLTRCRADAIAMEPQHATDSLDRLERAAGLS
jgi:hypothetical protein